MSEASVRVVKGGTQRKSTKTKEKSDGLKFTEYLGFGLSSLPGAVNTIIAAFLTIFYTDSVGLSAGAVGTMLLISKLMDGISDLVAGSIVDKTHTKWGKARPWLLWAAVPMGISIALIFFIPATGSNIGRMIYAFLTYNLFSTVMYTIVGIAGNALMPLLTQDGRTRGTLASIIMLFGLGGSIPGMPITFPFINAMGGDLHAWRVVFCVYGAVITLSMLASFFMVREHVTSVESADTTKKHETMTFKEGIRVFFKNKYFPSLPHGALSAACAFISRSLIASTISFSSIASFFASEAVRSIRSFRFSISSAFAGLA